MAKKLATIKALEKYYEKVVTESLGIKYRVTETPHWYVINVEDEYEQLAYYLSGNYDEIVDFCGSHCNLRTRLKYGKGAQLIPNLDNVDYENIYGLGTTEKKLFDATTKYVHKLGRKMYYEK